MLVRAAVIAAAVALAAPALAQPKATLVVGMAAQDIGSLDPHFAVSTIDRVPVAWMFNGLVRFPPGSIDPANIEPDLAQSWESSPDGLTWTFHLRHGVQFQGGFGELTAADVVFSLKKAGDAKTSAFSSELKPIKSIEVVDPYTVRLVLAQNIPSLLGIVTDYAEGYIVSKKAVEQRGDSFKRNPIGTGPFAFASDTPSQSLELVANDAYFRGAPKLRKISYRFIPSDASRDLAFQNNEIDVDFGRADQTWANRMKALPHSIVDVFEPGEEGELHLNITAKPLDDIRVRQAIAYAIDRDEMQRWRGKDVSREALSVVPRGYLGFTADNGLLPHNLAKAKELLKEAGYPNGVTIKSVQSQLPDMFNAAQVFQAQLKKAGITLDMQVVEHATYHQMIRQDLSPLTYYSAARFPVADIYLTQFFYGPSTVKTPTAVTNFSHCDVADKEIDAARVETDRAKQLALWAEAQKKIVADVCAVPMFETLQVYARHDNLDYGYKLTGSLSLGPKVTEATHFK
ncbi:MAG TPA: ABC transporter substrate-binding protein [Acetobacteraceae bacterium]|jgi:peptide/nickel transport system substrate-binding protein|nr:ABC transporter substrate-binding protein [Acetobacteraceae bacterium]